MKVAVLGRGNVGGGLADLWERAGHQVTRLGREGGSVEGADAAGSRRKLSEPAWLAARRNELAGFGRDPEEPHTQRARSR